MSNTTIREIARLTGTVAGTLHKELANLTEAGILKKETSGKFSRAVQALHAAQVEAKIIRHWFAA